MYAIVQWEELRILWPNTKEKAVETALGSHQKQDFIQVQNPSGLVLM